MIADCDLNNFGRDLPDQRDEIRLWCTYRRCLNYRIRCCGQLTLLRYVRLTKLASFLVLLSEVLDLVGVLLLHDLELRLHEEVDSDPHRLRLRPDDLDRQLRSQLTLRQISPRLLPPVGPILCWN
jgi:hypothetical protein